jgi:ppGpp synthetase/RelA/SpoT-type nucleotidyltranferase/serine/threonine protein phosphatase PrpC
MFVAAGLGNVAKLRMLARLEKAGVSGYKAVILAGGVGLTTEVTALWGANTLKETLFTDPSKVFTASHLAKSYGATLIMIGGLKGFGKVGGNLGPKAAKSLNLMAEGGTQLSRGGKVLVWSFGHGFGMGGMVATSHINQGLGLTPKPIGGWKEGLVHDVLGYVQFAVAHGAADRVFSGKMQEVSMRQHNAIAYKESILLAKGHADVMGFKAEALKVTVDKEGKLSVDGKPIEEFEAADKARIEGLLVKDKKGEVKDQTVLIDGSSRRLLVTLMTDAGLNRPGFSGLSLRRMVQDKKFAEANAYLQKHSVPLRFGKAGEVFAMGSQPGSPHALLGIDGKVEPVTDAQVKDLTPEPAPKPTKKVPPPPPPSKKQRKAKAKKKEAGEDSSTEDSPLIAARKGLPAPAAKTDSSPPPSGGSSPSTPRALPPPLPKRPLALPPVPVNEHTWAEKFASRGETDFAGKETMFRDGYNALNERVRTDPRFADPKFRAEMENTFTSTLDALRPILERTPEGEARTHLGQALFINVMQGKLTLADARELTAGALAGHYRVEKSPGWEYRCAVLYHGAEVPAGASLLVGKSGKNFQAIQGEGLVQATLADKTTVNFEFRQQDAKTTAIFEGRPGAARVEILDPASQKYRPLKDGERFEVQDGEAVLLGGDPFVFRSAESVAKETHQRQALLQERNELFHLRSEASQMIYGTDAWRAQALKVRKRRDAFDQLLKQEARNANGSSAIEGELLGLVSSLTPFAPAARKALKGELSPAEYRAAQTKIASPLVESHRNALEEVESYLNGLYADEFLEHRISTQIRDEAGKALENPHVRLKDPADVAPKLARRGWVAMEPMTDYAGARIVVKNTNDALAIAADIEKNLPVRDAFDGNGKPEKQEKDILGQEYKGGTETMEVTVKKDKDHPDRVLVGSESGYRALHIVVEIEGKPVEIQIQTESIFKWGKIQHSLIYKGKNSLPAETHKVLNEYCRDVAAYLTALEEGVKTDIPRPQEPQLPADLPSQLKNEIQTDLNRMSELMKYYHKLAEDESQVKTRIFKLENVDGAPKKPVSDEEVTKRYKIIQEPGDKSGVPERRGAAGGAKVVDLTGLSDSKSAPVAAKPSELRFSNGKVMTLAAESKVAILGTKDSAELRLKGPEIAAEHAEIIRDSKSRCVLRPLHGNSVKVLRDGRWIDLSKDGKAEGHELATGDKIRIGGSEFTWKSSPRLEQTGAEPAVPPRKPVPPPLPTVEAQFRKHSEVLQGKGTDLVNLLEISDRTLSGETTEWSPSFINVSMPDTAHIPVSSQFHRLTLVEFTEAKAKGELRDTAPLAYTLQIRGKQRAADLEARLRAEYGALLTADPKGGDGWVLRNPLGQAQVRIRFETKDLNVPSPVEARKVYEDFEKNSLQQLESWFRDETSGLTLENSYAFRMLQAVGPAADGKGGVRFGASFAEAVRRYETETNPVKKAQAGEQLATLCAIVKDAPARIREFKVTQEILRTLRNSELVGGLARARESGGPLAREAEIATEALKTLSLWENELRRLGEMLRRQVKIEDRKEGNPQFDAYKQKEDQILQSLNALRGFGKQLEDAGFKRKGPPPLPAAKKDIQGASDLPSQDLRSFDAATLDSLQKLGVANVEKLKDAEGPEYAQTLVSGMDHLLKQAPNGHVNHEMMLIRMINGLREWEKRSGQRLEWLEGYLQGFRRDRFGVPLDIPSAVTTPPERLSLSLEDQKRLNVTEVNPRNVLAVVEAIRTTTPQLDKIGGFSAFRLAPANEQLLFRILQNYGPYIQHKRPELGAYLHALFEVRSVYAADMEGGTPSGEPGTGKIPERRDGAAAKKADSSGDPLGFRYVEEISTNGLLGRELYTLAHPKPSLNKVIPGLTREMEMQFERGAQVRKWPTTGQFMIAETPSGSDTQVIRPATPVEVEAYRQWKDRRGFAPIPQAQARQAWKALEARAKALGIILYEGADLTRGPLRGEALEKFVRENGGQIAQVKELLDLLPASFFASGKLKRIFFKSPRQEDAHFSAYDAANGSLYLYAGAFNGSRRNLAGLFLHEAGHANAVRYRSNHEGDSQIPMTVRQDIALAHHVIVQQKALFALDWAGGKAERLRMQEKSLEEFLADVQLAYVAAGPELRAHYRSLPVGSAERRAWDYLYAELSDRVFGGLEFEYNNRPSSPPPVPPRVAFDQRPTLKYIPGGKSAPAEKSKSVPPPPSGKSATAKDPGPLPTRIEVPASYLQKAEGPAQKVESLNWGGIAAGRDPGFGPKATNNEDRYSIGSFNLPDGTHVVRSFVIDGMGGQGQGKGEFAGVFIRYVVEEASKHPKMNLEDAITMADRQLMEHPTHRQIAKEFGLDKAPGAVVVGMETRSLGNDEYQVKFAHVGDSEGFLMDSHFNVDAQAYTTREPITNRVLPRGLTLFSRINPFRNGVDQALGSRQEGKIDLRVDTADHKAKKGTIAVLGSDGLFENFIGKSEMSEVLQASGAKTARQMQKTLLNEALMRMYVFDRFKAEGRLGQAITHQDFAAAYQAIWGAPPPAGKWRYEGMILESSGLVTDPRIDPAHDHAKGIRGSFKRDHVTVLVQVLGERVTSKAEEENGFLPGVLPPASAFAAPEPSPVLKRLMELKP